VRLSKDDARIEACGALDELCSFLGWAKSLLKDVRVRRDIESVQKDLFVVGAQVASRRQALRIGEDDVKRLDALFERLKKQKGVSGYFCLPGDNPVSSSLDISRAVARRAERRLVTLSRRKMLKNRWVIAYLNRLSSVLYAMARAHERTCVPACACGKSGR
jgi:ATP:cob(I)alamin adenosyltransferase